MGDFLNALDEGTLHRLLHNANAMIGRVAQQIASNALSRATTKQDRRVFALALAEAERACLQFTRCLQRLRELAADPGPFRSPAEYLLQARILMVLADTHTNVMIGDALDVEEARSCIDRARQLIPFGDHLDRSDLLLVEAKLDEMEARTLQYGGGSSEDILRFRARAEFAILSAMNTYRLIKRWDRIDDALTELSFVPGGLKLQSVDNARGRLLIPWLYGVVRFRDEAYGRDWHGTPTNVSGTYRLHNLILEAFHTLPLDILASELPLPAQDCYQLLQRALLDFRNEEFDNSPELDPEERELPIEQAEWFLVQRAEEKARRGY